MINYLEVNDAEFTSKLCHLLNYSTLRMMRIITEAHLIRAFGYREVRHYDYEGGYTQPEWYFKSLTKGHIAGIGFRWGVPRLRGSNLTEEEANKFIELVYEAIAASSLKTRRVNE